MSPAAAVVADTNALLWYLGDPGRLSPAAATALRAATGAGEAIVVSAITLVELRYLVDKGTLGEDDLAGIDRALDDPASAFAVAPVDRAVARATGRIPRTEVADPADRVVAATGLVLGLAVVTSDRRLRTSPAVATVW